jgi:RNA-binding protein
VPKKRKAAVPLVPLSGKQKSYLRALAHPLKPVVQIGRQGLTKGVIVAVDAALERHELIKAKLSGDAELDAHELGPEIEKATHSQLAQIIGHTLVLYRRRAENPKIVLPRSKRGSAKASAPTSAQAEPADEEDDLE